MSIAVSPIESVSPSVEVPILELTVIAGATSRLASGVLVVGNDAHCLCKSIEPSEKKVNIFLNSPLHAKRWKV
jgi:hypothetical protein